MTKWEHRSEVRVDVGRVDNVATGSDFVEGASLGDWLVHKERDHDCRGGWGVTHMPTGRNIELARDMKLADAINVAAALASSAPSLSLAINAAGDAFEDRDTVHVICALVGAALAGDDPQSMLPVQEVG
jgi:hypothetical protein